MYEVVGVLDGLPFWDVRCFGRRRGMWLEYRGWCYQPNSVPKSLESQPRGSLRGQNAWIWC